MADNITLNAGAGGAVLNTDDIGGVHTQIIKVGYGVLDSLTLVSTSNPLPVDLRTDNLAGNLDVNLAASAATVTITGTVTANAGTGTLTTQETASLVDDAAFSPASSRLLPVGFTFDDTLPDSVDEGDIGAARMSANRNQYIMIRDGAGNERGVNVNASNQLSVSVDNSVVLAAGGNNIGDVDVVSFTAGAIVEVQGDVAHDAVAAGNPVLLGAFASAAAPAAVSADADAVRLWALRNGSLVVNVAAGGALILGDATNGLDVDVTRVTGTVTVAGTVTANAGTGTMTVSDTSTQVDDAAFTPATSRVQMMGATFDDTIPDSVDEGDGGAMRMSANRNLYTTLRDGLGNERGAAVNASNRLTVSVDNTAVVDINSLPNEGQQTMANSISVALASDQSNVSVAQATASALNAQVVGNVAHDSPDSGNPQKIGGVARTTNPTAVADGDRVNGYFDKLGRVVTSPYVPRERRIKNRVILTSTTETSLIAAGAAGVFRDLVSLDISNESATEVRIDIRDVTAGTPVWSIDLAADGGGVVKSFPVPLPQTTAASAWTAQLSSAVSSVYITAIAVEDV